MEEQKDLPKPLTDLPLPEKEIPAHTGGVVAPRSKWLKLGTLLIVLLLIGGSAYLLGKNNANKEIACTTEAKICPDGSSVGRTGPKCEFSPCPTPTPDPTADWKTYEDPLLGYSFKYPSKLKANCSDGQGCQSIDSFVGPGRGPENFVYVSVPRNGSAYNYNEEEVQLLLSGQIGESISLGHGFPSSFTYIRVDDSNLDGIMAKTFINKKPWEFPAGTVEKQLYFKHKGKTFLVGAYMESADISEELFDQILSTFKFTDSQASQNFLEIPEYGVKIALSENIKDAYYINDKRQMWLKVHSLDSEPYCKDDDSSTAVLARVGRNEINPMNNEKYSERFNGATVGDYYYYVDLAQYSCVQPNNPDKQKILDIVRKEFTEAAKTIQAL